MKLSKPVKAVIFIVLLIVLGVGAIYARRGYYAFKVYYKQHKAEKILESEKYIVHAGGLITGADGVEYEYSNSMDALEESYNNGHRVVEIDFRFTSDGELACLHNWWRVGVHDSGDDVPELTLEEFLNEKIYGQFTPMWMGTLAEFMREHKDLYIVLDYGTDDVEEFQEFCDYIAEGYPDVMNRMIMQIYHNDYYAIAYDSGFVSIIYTLYKASEEELSPENLIGFAESQHLVGYTIKKSYATEDEYSYIMDAVRSTGVQYYVHTIDDADEQQMFFDEGFTAVYTNVND